MRSPHLLTVIGNPSSGSFPFPRLGYGARDKGGPSREMGKGPRFGAGYIVLCFAIFAACDLFAQIPEGFSVDGFRIDTDVMQVDEAEPIIQSVAIFHQGSWYDYSRREPQRITVVQPEKNRITFLDQDRERQTTTSLQDLQAFLERARVELANSSLKEFLKDSEVVHIDEQSSTAVVGQQVIRYEAKFQRVQNSEIAKQYALFANASAYINSWQAPDRSPPSFARVRLNQVLEQRQAIPTEITRTIFTSDGTEHNLRSRLHVSWDLSQEDLKTVQKFQEMLRVFREEHLVDQINPTRVGNGSSISPSTGARR